MSSPSLLKMRLGLALQEDRAAGVRLGDVWNALHQVAPDLGRLAARVDWPLEPVLAINTNEQ